MTENNPIPPATPGPIPPMPPSDNGGAIYVGPPPDADAKNIAGLAQFFNVIWLVPLLIYLIKKDTHPFIKQESAEAVNFALTCFFVHIVCTVTAMFCVPAIISLALIVVQIVFGIIAGLKAKEGIPYKYFFSIKMVS